MELVKLNCNIPRDGHQSLASTRMVLPQESGHLFCVI